MYTIQLKPNQLSMFWAIRRTDGSHIGQPLKQEVVEWLRENAPNTKVSTTQQMAVFLNFESKDQALLFKLAM